MTSQNPPTTGHTPAPGQDEIILTAPTAGQLCSSREHRQAGHPAQVVVTLGQMGTASQHRQALWMETWAAPTRCASHAGRPPATSRQAAAPA
jgi:hypothetical protein